MGYIVAQRNRDDPVREFEEARIGSEVAERLKCLHLKQIHQYGKRSATAGDAGRMMWQSGQGKRKRMQSAVMQQIERVSRSGDEQLGSRLQLLLRADSSLESRHRCRLACETAVGEQGIQLSLVEGSNVDSLHFALDTVGIGLVEHEVGRVTCASEGETIRMRDKAHDMV
jgi:hypothetical protein